MSGYSCLGERKSYNRKGKSFLDADKLLFLGMASNPKSVYSVSWTVICEYSVGIFNIKLKNCKLLYLALFVPQANRVLICHNHSLVASYIGS